MISCLQNVEIQSIVIKLKGTDFIETAWHCSTYRLCGTMRLIEPGWATLTKLIFIINEACLYIEHKFSV
jgi:hypothetical protein